MATYKKLLKDRKGDTIIPVTDLLSDFFTTEVNTGTRWIDGSPIYKKTIECGALPNNAAKSVPHGITNLYRVLKLEGYAYSSTESQHLPFSYASPAAYQNSVGVFIQGSDIRLRTGIDRTSFTESYVTLYYTKTS